jgi:hypothetical protein
LNLEKRIMKMGFAWRPKGIVRSEICENGIRLEGERFSKKL